MSSKADPNAISCNMCFSALTPDTTVLAQKCCHVFCFKCARSWFKTNKICGFCNAPINVETDLRTVTCDLSGRSLWCIPPNLLNEMVSKALAFWQFQKQIQSSHELRTMAKGYEGELARLKQELEMKSMALSQAEEKIGYLTSQLKHTSIIGSSADRGPMGSNEDHFAPDYSGNHHQQKRWIPPTPHGFRGGASPYIGQENYHPQSEYGKSHHHHPLVSHTKSVGGSGGGDFSSATPAIPRYPARTPATPNFSKPSFFNQLRTPSANRNMSSSIGNPKISTLFK